MIARRSHLTASRKGLTGAQKGRAHHWACQHSGPPKAIPTLFCPPVREGEGATGQARVQRALTSRMFGLRSDFGPYPASARAWRKAMSRRLWSETLIAETLSL